MQGVIVFLIDPSLLAERALDLFTNVRHAARVNVNFLY